MKQEEAKKEISQKIKQDKENTIGTNIRRLRKSRNIGQTQMAMKLQLMGIDMTRETLVKIERGIQHVQVAQLRGIRNVLQCSYEDLLE